jgi:hypothetical protein
LGVCFWNCVQAQMLQTNWRNKSCQNAPSWRPHPFTKSWAQKFNSNPQNQCITLQQSTPQIGTQLGFQPSRDLKQNALAISKPQCASSCAAGGSAKCSPRRGNRLTLILAVTPLGKVQIKWIFVYTFQQIMFWKFGCASREFVLFCGRSGFFGFPFVRGDAPLGRLWADVDARDLFPRSTMLRCFVHSEVRSPGAAVGTVGNFSFDGGSLFVKPAGQRTY